jgi:single-strand DNA-binding protein
MINKVILLGRVGQDPESRFTADGTPVTSFSVATSDYKKNADGSKGEKTEWHKIVCWRKLAEIASQYVRKGSLVYVEGSIQSSEYEGRDGQKRKNYNIVANNFKMVGPKPGSQSQGDPDFPPEDDVPL